MTAYIVNLMLIALYAVIGLATRDSAGRVGRWLSRLVALQLIVLLALRDPSVGTDVYRYLDYFANARHGLTDSRFEIGFVALLTLARSMSGDPQLFLLIVAIASVVPVAVFIERESRQPLLSWTVYITLGFYGFVFSGLRQAIALGLTTMAISYVRRRSLPKFLICVLIASMFHASALIFLPAYWVYRLRLRGFMIVAYVGLVVVLFVFREQLFEFTVQYVYSSFEVVRSTAYSWLLLSALIVGLSSTRLRALRSPGERSAGLFNLALAGVTLMIFASVGTNVMRMADYYYIAVIALIPAVVETVSRRYRPLALVFVVLCLLGIYVIIMMESPYSIVPYVMAGS